MSIQLAPCFFQRREGILQFSAPAGLVSILHQAQDLVLAIEGGVQGRTQTPVHPKNLQGIHNISAAARDSL